MMIMTPTTFVETLRARFQGHSQAVSLRQKSRELGFSAIEMLVAVALLMAVLGVVVKGMTDMQKRGFSESSKMDSVQDARDFIDQMVRDIHMTGYPPPRATVAGGATPYCTDANGTGTPNLAMRDNPAISCGIVQFSPAKIVYEGDLDGSGTVSTIVLQLIAGNGGTCPCVLQRGVVTKAQWLAGNAPQYFTTVNGVLNSGNGATPPASSFGVTLFGPGSYASYSNADVFDAYLADGSSFPGNSCSLGEVNTPAITNPDCTQIRSLQITANVAPAYADPTTKQYPVYSITSKARVNF